MSGYCELYSTCIDQMKFVQRRCAEEHKELGGGDGRLLPGLPKRRFGACNTKLLLHYQVFCHKINFLISFKFLRFLGSILVDNFFFEKCFFASLTSTVLLKRIYLSFWPQKYNKIKFYAILNSIALIFLPLYQKNPFH